MKQREWYYKGTDYCRPIFTYEEITIILDAIEHADSQINIVPPELHRKVLHYKNMIEEKRAFDEK